MKTIITYGTFDVLHVGHVNILKLARSLGDRLIVGLSTDEFNLQKSKKSFHSYEDRKVILEAVKYVDIVVPEYSWNQKPIDIVDFEVDTFVMGGDWRGHFDELKKLCNVVYFDRTENISSTLIRNKLVNT